MEKKNYIGGETILSLSQAAKNAHPGQPKKAIENAEEKNHLGGQVILPQTLGSPEGPKKKTVEKMEEKTPPPPHHSSLCGGAFE